MQEDEKEKVGLSNKNYKKFSILAKLIEVTLQLGIIFMSFVATLIYLYIAIRSNKLLLIMLIPICSYSFVMSASTIGLIGLNLFLFLYYYKLIFDQINHQIQAIEKRSHKTVSFISQMRLLRLVKKHDLKAQEIKQINIMVHHSSLMFYVCLASLQTIPLHLFMESEVFIYQIIYVVHLIGAFAFGFGAIFIFSMQVNSAHKSHKTIYKILTKNLVQHKFSFNFKWKVI